MEPRLNASGSSSSASRCAAAAVPARPPPTASRSAARPVASISFLARDSDVAPGASVPPRATLAALLNTHDLLADEASPLSRASSQKFDLRRVPGRAALSARSLPRRPGARVRVRDRSRPPRHRSPTATPRPTAFEAEVAAIPKTIDRIVVEGAINRESPSLVQALDAAGERIELSLALADVVLRRDRLQQRSAAGRYVPAPRRARDSRGWRVCRLRSGAGGRIRQRRPGAAGGAFHATRGQARLLRLEGRSLKRFFLKSPLEVRAAHHLGVFARATSSGAQLHARAQRRRLRGASRSAGGGRGAWRGDVCRLDRWWRTHGESPPRAAATRANTCTFRASRFARGERVGQGELIGGWARRGSSPGRICTTDCGATAPTSIPSASIRTCLQASPCGERPPRDLRRANATASSALLSDAPRRALTAAYF